MAGSRRRKLHKSKSGGQGQGKKPGDSDGKMLKRDLEAILRSYR